MNPMTRLAVVVGRQPWLHRYAGLIVRTDLVIQRLTRGRFNLLTLAGLPEVTLTVPGRRTGVPRTTPLLCVPYGGGWLVAGSNWGDPKPPAWVHNLAAAGAATVVFRGRTVAATARRLDGDERERCWRVMLETWPNYQKYAERTERELPVFLLSPA
jgi:deazaflavin-dependent oxidoreductase (nitroreductase family)